MKDANRCFTQGGEEVALFNKYQELHCLVCTAIAAANTLDEAVLKVVEHLMEHDMEGRT